MRTFLLAAVVGLTLAGCGTLTMRSEYEHISHPTVQGVSREDTLDQFSIVLRTERDGWYMEGGLGWNANRVNGGGFKGPELTGTYRFGREFKLYTFEH